MRKIKNIERIINTNGVWKPSDLAFIKSLEWTVADLVIVFYCQLRNSVNGWPDTSKDFFEVSIVFSNVSSWKLDFNSIGLQQISGFDIIDISSNGLEKVNFQIEDYENGIIGFYCEDVEVREVSKPFKVSF